MDTKNPFLCYHVLITTSLVQVLCTFFIMFVNILASFSDIGINLRLMQPC
jgi:hypothetical protein